MKEKTVEIINKSSNPLPKYMTSGASGLDIRANIDKSIIINSLERVLIPTGIYMSIPEGFEIQVRPRSGLALKHGITVLNSPGTIDAKYRIIGVSKSDKHGGTINNNIP